ncbi:MAG: ORF6N domain-containing protein [Deltaproteobacteria bacterium]|nr:ORF6N domain-containing protein [Deltaproteobacteria bacterium]
MTNLVPAEHIENSIFIVRGHKVMLDSVLALLYEVKTKELNKAFKRNKERFPEDFVFRLTAQEAESLRFQIGTSNNKSQLDPIKGRGGRRYLPYVFTEQGVAMLSSVLRSKRAILVNVEIMRTFVRLRRLLSSNKDLARKLAGLERKYDHQFKVVFDAIRELMSPPVKPTKRIGFITAE